MMDETSVLQVSVIDPVGKALKRTKQILFSPFGWSKWFTIGFCAWLTFLCGSGGGSFFNTLPQESRLGIRHFVESNLYWIIPTGIVFILFTITVIVILGWVHSRGKFMFLYCVARNKAEVKCPWTEYSREGNSLFLFNIVLWLAGMICFIPIIIGWIVVIIPIVRKERFLLAAAGMIAILTLITLLMVIVFRLITKFTTDFVISTMFTRRIRCIEAWKRVWKLIKDNFGRTVLYILFQIVMAIAIDSILVIPLFFLYAMSCCCLFPCFLCMAFPCIGLPVSLAFQYMFTVILLPLLIFKRSYSALYLAQYGPQWDVFAEQTPAEVIVAENIG
jgi:hypothetical protein